MLCVFGAEDESLIRETLRDTVPWNQYGYEFAGEVGVGEMALHLIRQAKSDVLITDIRMPFMDGLALSELVYREIEAVTEAEIDALMEAYRAAYDFAKDDLETVRYQARDAMKKCWTPRAAGPSSTPSKTEAAPEPCRPL